MGVYQTGNTRDPSSMVMLLHGYGANGQDLLGLGDVWAPSCPGTVFVAPDAPQVCDLSPFGYQWFGLTDWSPASMSRGAAAAAPWIDAFIDDQLARYHLKPDRLVLVGFSQGTMMALYVATRRAPQIAGVLGYSGALIGAEGWAQNPPVSKPSVCLVHGLNDTVVPVPAFYHAEQSLKQAGFTVTGTVIPGLLHNINDQGLTIGQDFLNHILSCGAAPAS